MTWRIVVTRPAERAFRKMPKKDAARIAETLRAMEHDPFSGDVVALQGIHRGAFRRRVGAWRIFFELQTDDNMVVITNIRRRTSQTY